jgi:hypothetical protein
VVVIVAAVAGRLVAALNTAADSVPRVEVAPERPAQAPMTQRDISMDENRRHPPSIFHGAE